MLSSTIRQSGDPPRRIEIEAVAGVAFEAEFVGGGAAAQAFELGFAFAVVAGLHRVRHHAGVRILPPRAQRHGGAQGLGIGFDEQGHAHAARQFRHEGRGDGHGRPTSRPPSVVRSVRFSGTRHAACGFTSSAMSSIRSVAAISKFSGFDIAAFRRRMSSSRIWRRSSRRCAVTPSAGVDRQQRRANWDPDRAPPRCARSRRDRC